MTMYMILCLSCNIKKSKTTAKLSENTWTQGRSNRYQWRHLWRQHLYCYRFFVILHESGTRNALLGPWLKNTGFYFIPFISTQNQKYLGHVILQSKFMYSWIKGILKIKYCKYLEDVEPFTIRLTIHILYFSKCELSLQHVLYYYIYV